MTPLSRKRIRKLKKQKRLKGYCQKQHAIKRARERYDSELTESDYDKMVKTIREGRSKILFRESRRLTHHEVDGMHVVYDSTRGTIVTFLPHKEKKETT